MLETSSGAGVPYLLGPDGRGTSGNGLVTSLSLSGQNGRMLSFSAERPLDKVWKHLRIG